ncbi:armadillo-type protein [Pisolithus albus]|nr:armadillo-type protein [Pisolithus albus]
MTSLAFVKRVFVTRIIMDIGFVCAASSSYTPQQYSSASYRAAGECVEGKQHGYLLMPPSVYPTDVLVQPAYMLMLSSELANESSQIPIRNAAALALKNNLSARIQYTTRRLSLDNDTKAKIKQEVLVTLASPLLGAGGFAQVVTAIASVVFPHDQWPDLIKLVLLLSFVNNLTNTNLRIATLQTIGYICESIKPDILSLRSNEILTAVIRGARQHEPPSGVQLAAVHALYNSLEFVRENFKREGERNHIIRVVFYRDGFWTTVCEEGIELAHEAREAADYGEPPEAESKFFAKIALPEVIPVLLSLLTFQEDVVDEDERNVSMSISTCFNFIARAVTDPIVDAVIPFIEAYIKSPDRHQWEAAVMALWVYPGWFRSKCPDRHQLLGMQIVGIDDQNNWNKPQSNHCSVVIVNITFLPVRATVITYSVLPERTRWLGEGIQPMAGHIMTLVLRLIQTAGQTSKLPLF